MIHYKQICKNYLQVFKTLKKKKLEAIAQLNAFQGAAQQCQMFLTEINNEKASSDNPGDMGTLPDTPDDKYETNQEKDDAEAPM